MSDIETIIAHQAALMDALDARDVGRIEQFTKELAKAIELVRKRGALVVGDKLESDVGYALKQTEALKTRVNFMALRNREKMERLDQMRGSAAPHVYGNRRNTKASPLPA
jgi:hypothetical protein